MIAGADRDPLDLWQQPLAMPLPNPVLADPCHLTDLGNAVGLAVFFHVSNLLDVWFAGDN